MAYQRMCSLTPAALAHRQRRIVAICAGWQLSAALLYLGQRNIAAKRHQWRMYLNNVALGTIMAAGASLM